MTMMTMTIIIIIIIILIIKIKKGGGGRNEQRKTRLLPVPRNSKLKFPEKGKRKMMTGIIILGVEKKKEKVNKSHKELDNSHKRIVPETSR